MAVTLQPIQQTFNTGQYAGIAETQQNQQGDPKSGGSGSAPPKLPPAILNSDLAAALTDILTGGGKPVGDGDSGAQASRLQNILASSVSGDTASFLARAMLKFESLERRAAVSDRQNLGISAQAEMLASASKLDQEASQTTSAALVSLITTVVSAAVTIGTASVGGAMKASSLSKEIGGIKSEVQALEKASTAEAKAGYVAEKEADPTLSRSDKLELERMKREVPVEIAEAKAEGKRGTLVAKEADRTANIGMVVSQVGEGVAKAIGAGGDYNSKMTEGANKTLEADAKRLDAAVENLRTQADGKKAIMDALNELVQQIVAFVKDMADAKADRMQSITRA